MRDYKATLEKKITLNKCQCGSKVEYIISEFSNTCMVYCPRCAKKVAGKGLVKAAEVWNKTGGHY